MSDRTVEDMAGDVMEIDALSARLLRRTLGRPSSAWGDPQDARRTYPLHGGYDADGVDLSDDETALLIALHDLPWCDKCDDFIAGGAKFWTHRSRTFCDRHWRQFADRQRSAGRNVIEEASDGST